MQGTSQCSNWRLVAHTCTCTKDTQLWAGTWHVGAKRAFELFPKGLQSRSKMERKKRWDALQRVSVTAAAAQASAFKDKSVRSHAPHPFAFRNLPALSGILTSDDQPLHMALQTRACMMSNCVMHMRLSIRPRSAGSCIRLQLHGYCREAERLRRTRRRRLSWTSA